MLCPNHEGPSAYHIPNASIPYLSYYYPVMHNNHSLHSYVVPRSIFWPCFPLSPSFSSVSLFILLHRPTIPAKALWHYTQLSPFVYSQALPSYPASLVTMAKPEREATYSLAESMKLPYPVNSHDMEIEYYFKDVESLIKVSAEPDFKALHAECEPYVDLATTTITLTWVEVYLEDGKLVNVDADGKSMQPSFKGLNAIKETKDGVAKYY